MTDSGEHNTPKHPSMNLGVVGLSVMNVDAGAG